MPCYRAYAKSKIGHRVNTEGNRRNTKRNMRKHQEKGLKTVRKPGKHNIDGITIIIVPETKRQNVSMISIDQVFQSSANLH